MCCVTGELDVSFSLILINLKLNDHMWLGAVILGSLALEF